MSNYSIPLTKIDENLIDLNFTLSGNSLMGGIFSETIRNTELELSSLFDSTALLTNSGTNAIFVAFEYALMIAANRKTVINVSEYVYFSVAAMLKKLENVEINILSSEDEVTLSPEDIKMGDFTIFFLTSHNSQNVNKIVEKSDDIIIIEDRCVVLGNGNNKNVSDIQCYSFSNNKMIVAGEGGCIVSDNTHFIEWARKRLFCGINPTIKLPYFFYMNKYKSNKEGNYFKCSTNNLTAMLISAQIKVLDKIIERRKNNFVKLSENLEVQLPVPQAPLFFKFPVNLSNRQVQKLQLNLFGDGIQNSLGLMPFSGECKISKYLNLPVHSCLTEKEIEYISTRIKTHYQDLK